MVDVSIHLDIIKRNVVELLPTYSALQVGCPLLSSHSRVYTSE